MAVEFKQPGVYLNESPFTAVNTDLGSATAVGVFVGVANKGPIDSPTRIESWTDFVTIFGGFDRVTGLSAQAPVNQVYIRGSSTELTGIASPVKGDLAFVNGYRHSASTFYKADETDSNSEAEYYQPHAIWVYDGFTWVDTRYRYHSESKLFDGWDSLNVPVQIKMVTANQADPFSAPSGSYNYGDIVLRYDLDSERWRVFVFGSKSTNDASQAVFKTVSTKGDFVGFTTTSGSNVYGLGAGWTELISSVSTGLDTSLKTATNTAQNYWGPLRFSDSQVGTGSSVTDAGYVSYIYLQDPPGSYNIGPADIWDTWFPTLTTSSQSSVQAFSYLPYALYCFFQSGGRTAYVVRSVGSNGGVRAETAYMDSGSNVGFKFQALGAGTWANGQTGGISTLVTQTALVGTTPVFTVRVYLNGNEVERFQQLSMIGDVPGTKRVDVVLNDPTSGSQYVRLINVSQTVTPLFDSANGAPRPLGTTTAGTDPDLPSSPDLSASVVAAVPQLTGPLLVNVVGYTTDLSDESNFVTASLQSSELDRTDVFIIADNVRRRLANETPENYRNAVTAVFSGISNDSRVAAYTPWIVIPDPAASGATITVPPGGAVMGVYARTDATAGVFRAPAGQIGTLTNAINVDCRFTDTQGGGLNHDNVNVIKPVTGAGITIWGARTRKAYGPDRFISARRTLIYLNEVLTNATQFAVFENNDQRLWTRLSVTADAILRPLWAAGGLAGASAADAYFVKCDSTVNTPAVVASGEVRMQIGVALEQPAEFVIITLSQFEGNTTFTVQS